MVKGSGDEEDDGDNDNVSFDETLPPTPKKKTRTKKG